MTQATAMYAFIGILALILWATGAVLCFRDIVKNPEPAPITQQWWFGMMLMITGIWAAII